MTSSRASFTIPADGFRRRRLAKLLSQQELAKAAKVSRFTITRIEGGVDDPVEVRGGTVRKLAEALGCEPDDLLRPAEVAS